LTTTELSNKTSNNWLNGIANGIPAKTGNLFPPDSVQFRHFYRKRSGRRKPEKETGWQQQVSL